MDKEKLKKYAGYAGRYAGYAGLGLVGGYLIGFISEFFLELPYQSVSYLCGLVGGLGGLLVGVIVDKEKLKKYAGYAGLGLVGGFISFLLGFFLSIKSILESAVHTIGLEILIYIIGGPIILLVSILGGCIGGAITKKWWGSLVAGFFLSGLVFFLMLSDYIL